MTPEEMLRHLCEKAPRQRASLEAVYATCKEIVDSKGTDLRYATVARLGADKGCPKAQSIANRSGAHYQALIKCFANDVGTRKRPERTRSGDAWADEIPDPRQRLLAQTTLAELARVNRTLKEIVPPGHTIRIDDRSAPVPGDFRLSNLERRALEYLKSDDFLIAWKLKRGKVGDVIDSKDNAVFKPYTINALEKVLKHL